MTLDKALTTAPTTLSHNDLMTLLQQSGMVQAPSSNFRRMRVDNGTLVTLDAQGNIEEQYPPRFKGKTPLPALTVRIVEPPVYYTAIWLDPDESRGGFDAARVGRAELNKSFAKKYDSGFIPEYKGDADAIFDELVAAGAKGKFSADIKLQIVPDNGQMTGDEVIYTLTLSTTAALDWRGSRRNPEGGVVQEENFIVQLATFAMNEASEAGGEEMAQQKAVLDAMTALRLGGVIADLYLLRAQNADATMTWTVPAFKPVHIEYTTPAAALTSPVGADESSDEIGF